MLRNVDELEKLSILAIFNAKASNAKKVSPKKLFNADKMRKDITKKETDKKIVYTKQQRSDIANWMNDMKG